MRSISQLSGFFNGEESEIEADGWDMELFCKVSDIVTPTAAHNGSSERSPSRGVPVGSGLRHSRAKPYFFCSHESVQLIHLSHFG
ncbi:MAG: hypothetical protein ACFCBU_05855 [Cyanophyceae cyanobacterium]